MLCYEMILVMWNDELVTKNTIYGNAISPIPATKDAIAIAWLRTTVGRSSLA